jgi:hypothetical protein
VSNKTLSKRLKFWRAERPDEWVMDEFIRDAEVLERQLNDLAAKLVEVNNFCQKRGIGKIGDSAVSALMQRHGELEAKAELLMKEAIEK